MFACKSCEGFLCTLRAGHGDVCGDEDVAQLWWDNHGLTRIFKACLDSAHEPILCEKHVNGCYVCPFHVCRRRYSKNVVLSTQAKVGVSTCLKVMFGYANGDRMDCITQDAHITKNTTTKFVQRLEAILAWYMRFCTEKQACQVKNMQVDETCFGKRKYKVGKPVSGHGQTWFQVAVQTSRDGGPTERVFVKHLPNRRASSLSPLVTGLRHRYGIVRTDDGKLASFTVSATMMLASFLAARTLASWFIPTMQRAPTVSSRAKHGAGFASEKEGNSAEIGWKYTGFW